MHKQFKSKGHICTESNYTLSVQIVQWISHISDLVCCVMFCRSSFVLLSFSFWPLDCLSFFFWPLDCLSFFFWLLHCLSFFWLLYCLSFFFWLLYCLSFFWLLYCLSFFLWLLYCLYFSVGHCIVCPSSIFGF